MRNFDHSSTTDVRNVLRPLVLAVLTEMAVQAQTAGWTRPGWGTACSDLRCAFCSDGFEHTGCACKHQQAKLERMADAIVDDDSREYRLNGAGLKLYTRGIKTGGAQHGVSFNMRVGGDQAVHYPQFVQWANARLAEMQLTDDALAAA